MKKSSFLRSPGILVVALIVMVAATGLVYAHWMTTLRVDANVNTGGVSVQWLDAFTNDDGVDNGDGEPDLSPPVYDAWEFDSSTDPSEPMWGGTRYDKDVGACWASIEGDRLQINVENAYPSYHCAVQAELANRGSIPLRATEIRADANAHRCGYWEWEIWDGTDPGPFYDGQVGWDDTSQTEFADLNGNGILDPGEYPVWNDCRDAPMDFVPGLEGSFTLDYMGIPEIEGDIALGIMCGTQIDPIPCGWYFASNDLPWDGHVDWCNEFEGDNRQCAYDETGSLVGEVYESCDGPAYTTAGWFHVLQEADQNTQYRWTLEQDFVNWNEFDYCMCTEGVPAADPDGTIIGVVDWGAVGVPDGPPDCVVSMPPGGGLPPGDGDPPAGP